ncbi:Hypothetical predicted protein [Podarcis lilfordi]|uniref:Uncharacterized protein n=1 Tax=Podarcis lilfordi TaxID=74358 RepID=A0AA35L295_9SAUR|nr:Hypothetical predicted protein [Podarcis lilfordi]
MAASESPFRAQPSGDSNSGLPASPANPEPRPLISGMSAPSTIPFIVSESLFLGLVTYPDLTDGFLLKEDDEKFIKSISSDCEG